MGYSGAACSNIASIKDAYLLENSQENTMKNDKEQKQHKFFSIKQFEDFYQDPHTVESYFRKRFGSPLGYAIHSRESVLVNKYLKYVPEDGTILELAPGPARLTGDIEFSGLKVGMDKSRQMLGAANDRLKGKKWNLLQGDAFSIPFPDEEITAVISFRFLRHFQSKERSCLWKELRRVVKPGGYLIFDALNRGMPAFAFRDAKIHLTGIYDELWEISELRGELDNNGWELFRYNQVVGNLTISYMLSKLFSPFGRISRIGAALIILLGSIPTRSPFQWVVICRKK